MAKKSKAPQKESAVPKKEQVAPSANHHAPATSEVPLNPHAKERNLAGYAGVTARGAVMGAADVIPGVSGGTMALILGIYEELIASIRSFDMTALRLLFAGRFRDLIRHTNLIFLIFLLAGIGGAILALAKIIPQLLDKHPAPVHGLFFGLILASIVLVWRQVQTASASTFGLAFLGALGAYLLVGLIPIQTPDSYWFLFLCGCIAIIAMILPGISGSFILLLLGKYAFILETLRRFVQNRKIDQDFFVVAVFALGCIVGILAFSRVLNWLLEHYHAATLALLAGLMVGSLRRIWLFQEYTKEMIGKKEVITKYANILPKEWGGEQLLAVALVFVGIGIVFGMDYMVRKQPA